MEDLIAASIQDSETIMVLILLFAAVSIMLATLGIYGVMSQVVSEGKYEMGIRMACGATDRELIAMVLKRGVMLAALGTAIGLGSSLLLTGLIRGQLYGVAPSDPVTYVAVALLVMLVAGTATLIPGIRAARTDPCVALRAE
jgi:ABC-type antimicrobial peptide transport system permease subunit